MNAAPGPRGSFNRAAVRRAGSLAMIDHRLRGAPAPVNPYKPTTKRHFLFDWGAQQADNFCAPIREYRRESGQ